MPREHARRLRWSAYAASVMAAVLCQMWCSGARSFPATPAFFWSIGAIVALLAVGRAVMLLPLAGAAVAVGAAALPRALGGDVGSVEAVACALATIGLAGPYVVRLLRGPAPAARVRVAGVPAELPAPVRVEPAVEADDGADEASAVARVRGRRRRAAGSGRGRRMRRSVARGAQARVSQRACVLG
jgi:hypothetical protein